MDKVVAFILGQVIMLGMFTIYALGYNTYNAEAFVHPKFNSLAIKGNTGRTCVFIEHDPLEKGKLGGIKVEVICDV